MEIVTITRNPITEDEMHFLSQFYGPKLAGDTVRIWQELTSKNSSFDGQEELFTPIKTNADFDRLFSFTLKARLVDMYRVGTSDFEAYLRLKKQQKASMVTLVLTDICDKYRSKDLRCGHCMEGPGRGQTMDFDQLTNIDEDFLRAFHTISLARRGEPFLYNSNGKNVGDVVEFIISKGVKNISALFGVFNPKDPRYEQNTARLEQVMQEHPEVKFDVSLTYHHFISNHKEYEEMLEDQEKFDKHFMYALECCSRFADLIAVKPMACNLVQGAWDFNVNYCAAQKLKEHLMSSPRIGQITDVWINEEQTKSEIRGKFLVKIGGRLIEYRLNPTYKRLLPIGEFARTLDKVGKRVEYEEESLEREITGFGCFLPDAFTVNLEPSGHMTNCNFRDPQNFECNVFEGGYQRFVNYYKTRFEVQAKLFTQYLAEMVFGDYFLCDFNTLYERKL